MKCCICGKTIKNSGNNPDPYVRIPSARCCDNCNAVHVIPLRIKLRDRDYNLYIENGLEPLWTSVKAYKDFPEIKPTPFNVLFKDKDYKIVQLHDIAPIGNAIYMTGFVGCFSWLNNELKPLYTNYATYYPEMLVYGYKETDNALHILVKDW